MAEAVSTSRRFGLDDVRRERAQDGGVADIAVHPESALRARCGGAPQLSGRLPPSVLSRPGCAGGR